MTGADASGGDKYTQRNGGESGLFGVAYPSVRSRSVPVDARRSNADTKLPSSARTATPRSVVPECEFDEHGRLAAVRLYPCNLQPRAPTPQRGTPALATGDEAREILETIAERSTAFGTTVRREGDTATVAIDPR